MMSDGNAKYSTSGQQTGDGDNATCSCKGDYKIARHLPALSMACRSSSSLSPLILFLPLSLSTLTGHRSSQERNKVVVRIANNKFPLRATNDLLRSPDSFSFSFCSFVHSKNVNESWHRDHASSVFTNHVNIPENEWSTFIQWYRYLSYGILSGPLQFVPPLHDRACSNFFLSGDRVASSRRELQEREP